MEHMKYQVNVTMYTRLPNCFSAPLQFYIGKIVTKMKLLVYAP